MKLKCTKRLVQTKNERNIGCVCARASEATMVLHSFTRRFSLLRVSCRRSLPERTQFDEKIAIFLHQIWNTFSLFILICSSHTFFRCQLFGGVQLLCVCLHCAIVYECGSCVHAHCASDAQQKYKLNECDTIHSSCKQ